MDKNEINRQIFDDDGKLIILARKTISLNGVLDVLNFDESNAMLRTTLGTLVIDGEELHFVKLDLESGAVVINGKINAIFYSEAGGSKGKTKRLLR